MADKDGVPRDATVAEKEYASTKRSRRRGVPFVSELPRVPRFRLSYCRSRVSSDL
jgi:hypothetical protein